MNKLSEEVRNYSTDQPSGKANWNPLADKIEQLEQQLADLREDRAFRERLHQKVQKENQRLRQALEAIAQGAVLDNTGNCSPLLDDYCAYAALTLENEDWPHGTAKWL